MKRAVDVHEAAIIDGGADFCAGIQHSADFVGEHGGGDIGILDGEGAAEAAALLNILDGLQIEPSHVFQQTDGNVAEVQAAHGVATSVIGNLVRIGRADIVDAELADEEFGEFVNAREKRFDICDELCIAVHLGGFEVVIAHHGDAGGGWNDDGFCILIDADKVTDDRDGFAQVASIPVHLTAAGLLGAELDFMAEALENAYDGFACLGEESIVVAGNEK